MANISGGGGAKISTILIDADLDMAAQKIVVNTIDEKTPAAGVTIDSALIKDGSAATKVSTLTIDTNIDMGVHDLKTDDIKESTGNNGVDVDGVSMKDDKIITLDAMGGSVINKIVSDNLRNSHDAEVDTPSTGASYLKIKTITYTNGVKGTLRIKFDLKDNAGYVGYGRVYKNGVALGTIQTGTDNYVTESEDLDVGTIAAGETLELWGKAEHGNAHVFLRNFRCYYDDGGCTAVGVNT